MNSVAVFDEPRLEFANGESLEHPRDGLSLFGPPLSKVFEKPQEISYGVVGTRNGVAAFREFVQAINRPVLTEAHLDEVLWPHFPGFEEIFQSHLARMPSWVEELDNLALKNASTERDDHKRVFGVTSLFLDSVRVARDSNKKFHFFVMVVPDFVFATCRPLSRFHGGHGTRVGKKEQRLRAQILDFFENYEPEQYSWSLDFRCQMKARMMALDFPIQIVRESTLRLGAAERRESGRQLTPLSDRAWNLSTAFYYKAGGLPWKLSGPREGVCHLGVSFRESEVNGAAYCLGQMLQNDGDGLVIPGEEGPWHTGKTGEYHLKKENARQFLTNALVTFKSFHRHKLKEIYLHYRSSVNEEEFEGYREACPEGVKLVAVRVAPERFGLRLYRTGSQPVLRGTFWQVTPKRGFLWTSGFKPRLRGYDGTGVPTPLCIEVLHGDAEVARVARDLFGLTKLNYNCCNLGEFLPGTFHSSGVIGEIVAANRNVRNFKASFRYYL